MSFIATISGVSYTLPTEGDEGWGPDTSSWMAAASTKLLQTGGGSFTLLADVNFGASFGTVQTYLKSRSSNIAATGVVRLAHGDVIAYRNNANSADLPLGVDSSDRPTWDGVPILVGSGGVLPAASGGTGISSYTAGDLLYASGSTTLSKLAIGSANTALLSNGSVPAYGLIADANIDASAAIARSKLASGTNYRILANDGSGVMSENAALTAAHVIYADANGQLAGEANLAISRGGTNAGTAVAAFDNLAPTTTRGDLITRDASNNVRVAVGAAGTVLRSDGTDPSWGGFAPIQKQIFTSSGDFTVPANVTSVKVTVVGGGGGGGGNQANGGGESSEGGGGGGGGTAIKWVTGLTPSASISVTVGTGGAGGSAGANNGSPGGTSSFGTHCSATGGLGGVGGASSSTFTQAAGGAGGAGSSGDINLTGGTGGYGVISGGNPFRITSGGASFLGASVKPIGSAAGSTGLVYGGGGSGGTTGSGGGAQAGGTGANGIVIVEWIAV